MVAAVGPADWLLVTCHSRDRHCRNEVADASTGALAASVRAWLAPGYFYSTWPPVGVTSPDGTTAAVPVSQPERRG